MNFKRILSKSSIKSSSSSGKSLSQSEEVTKLQSDIKNLKQTIDSLKVALESRDAAIGTLAREKEHLYVELKSAQRTNRNLHQELIDERHIHSKEKEHLIDEIKRLSDRSTTFEKLINTGQTCVLTKPATNDALLEELQSKDEVICNISTKYLKIMSSKKLIEKKLRKTMHSNQKICENLAFLLQENKRDLDHLLNKLVECSTVIPDTRQYLKLLRNNANLHYENTQMKVYIAHNTILRRVSGEELLNKDQSFIYHTTSNDQNSKHIRMQSCRIPSHNRYYVNTKKRGKSGQTHQQHTPCCYQKMYCSYSDPYINPS